LKPAFKDILNDFFPRYVRILRSPKYRDAITEIRIEGHTSSDWIGGASPDDAYLHNMELSQARTRSSLLYVLMLSQVRGDVDWLRRLVTANGLSSSRPILDAFGNEDAARSRRVEFKIPDGRGNKNCKDSGGDAHGSRFAVRKVPVMSHVAGMFSSASNGAL
jgi:outer membrane protein OmpA-like peptidoglycan-associated protein